MSCHDKIVSYEGSLVIAKALFQQPKRLPYTWTSPDSQYQSQTDYVFFFFVFVFVFCIQRWKSSTQSAKIKLGTDCDSDHELLIAKFRLKLKKVGAPLDNSGMT